MMQQYFHEGSQIALRFSLLSVASATKRLFLFLFRVIKLS